MLCAEQKSADRREKTSFHNSNHRGCAIWIARGQMPIDLWTDCTFVDWIPFFLFESPFIRLFILLIFVHQTVFVRANGTKCTMRLQPWFFLLSVGCFVRFWWHCWWSCFGMGCINHTCDAIIQTTVWHASHFERSAFSFFIHSINNKIMFYARKQAHSMNLFIVEFRISLILSHFNRA